nr:lycopene beta-cyclase CrtY [uncultured Sphingomonas sp.]
MSATISCDLAIVGGGLAGGLIARAVHARHPAAELRLIEASSHIGGNHLWSFFASDIAPADRWLVSPLISHQWTRYDVAFPGHARTLKSPYYSIDSRHFERVLLSELPDRTAMLGRDVVAVTSNAVALTDGDRVEAKGVIDCRGVGDLATLELGWQKFLGRELVLRAPHHLERPVVMDATVEQTDGYRFAYCLPFAPDRVFVEDTYYSDTPDIDAAALGDRVHAYAAAQGWQVDKVAREETGVLPVAIGGDFEAYWQSGGGNVAKAGVRAGLFHPLTSYSLPDAVRTAALVANAGIFDGQALRGLLHDHARRLWRSRRFYRMLAAMLFRAAEPAERYRILERFYRLDERLIGRFYAAESNLGDKIRVMTGKPPVPIGRAARAIMGVE